MRCFSRTQEMMAVATSNCEHVAMAKFLKEVMFLRRVRC